MPPDKGPNVGVDLRWLPGVVASETSQHVDNAAKRDDHYICCVTLALHYSGKIIKVYTWSGVEWRFSVKTTDVDAKTAFFDAKRYVSTYLLIGR